MNLEGPICFERVLLRGHKNETQPPRRSKIKNVRVNSDAPKKNHSSFQTRKTPNPSTAAAEYNGWTVVQPRRRLANLKTESAIVSNTKCLCTETPKSNRTPPTVLIRHGDHCFIVERDLTFAGRKRCSRRAMENPIRLERFLRFEFSRPLRKQLR